MKQQRYAVGAVVVAALLPVLGWATDWDTPGGPAGRVKPGPNGPFRNDPAQGIPKHAYSPFDPKNEPKTNALVAGRDYLPGRLVVKLKSPAAAQSLATTAVPDVAALHQRFAAHGVTSLDRVFPNAAAPAVRTKAVAGSSDGKPDLTRWLRAKCADQEDIPALVIKLSEDPDVEYAEPDMVRRPAGYIPNGDADPLFASQWHLPAAHIPEAWAYLDSLGLPPGGNRDIVVAVIDTGVDYNHPDLAVNMWTNSREIPGNGKDDDGNGFVDDVHGVTVVSDSRFHSGNPMDDHGHGTHVAGIIAAQAGNSNGVVGVAYNCQIMAIKAAQYSGVLAASDIAEGINYAVAQGADIINMSFGGYKEAAVERDALAVAFGQCVLVAAAGNDGFRNTPPGRPMYPAAYDWVLGVMASGSSNRMAWFSNWDNVPHDSFEYEVIAPGVNIWSTLPMNQYAAWSGTSMAAPVVSGIAALLRTRFADKDTYSSRFIMGQIAGTATYANALEMLTNTPKPELTFKEFRLFDTSLQATNNDNDGRTDSGETIDLAITIRNHWGSAGRVTATLDAWADGAVLPDPYVTMISNVVDYGTIGSFNWDDNGLILSNGIVTGVRSPFRFQVSPGCPNDHLIPFRLTMTCRNGLDTNDTAAYTFSDRLYVMVEHGRQLPRILTNDMVMTKDDYWLVPGPTLIPSGVSVIITNGAQVQFSPGGYFQVEGRLVGQGTIDEPIELFNTGGDWAVDASFSAPLCYAKIRNPNVSAPLIDHCYFDQTFDNRKDFGMHWARDSATHQSCLISAPCRFSIFYGIASTYGLQNYQNLLDGCKGMIPITWNPIYALWVTGESSVFLMGDLRADRPGFYLPYTGGDFRPVSRSGTTYFAVPRSTKYSFPSNFADAERFAQSVGGHLVSIHNAEEDAFLRSYVSSGNFVARFGVARAIIGLECQSGVWGWTSGDPVTYFPAGAEFLALRAGSQMITGTNWILNAEEAAGLLEWPYPYLIEVPGELNQAKLNALLSDEALTYLSPFKNNAILRNWIPGRECGLYFQAIANFGRGTTNWFGGNFWGTDSPELIETAMTDFNDNFNLGIFAFDPILTNPPVDCYPFVADVIIAAAQTNVSVVGLGPVQFTAVFNRDMSTNVQPQVSFGPATPYTDLTVHPLDDGWQTPRIWVGTVNITPLTGDGYQYIRIANAVAADDPWLVTGNDQGRFRFEVVTSGTEAMNLQATGGEGHADLSWRQDDFDLLAGYNLYRSTAMDGTFTRVNSAIIPAQQRSFGDTNLLPAATYYYKFTVVQTDMTESRFSNLAQATTLDTIPPVLSHLPLTIAQAGLPLTLFADATDNVGVQAVTLFFRAIGETNFLSRAMTRVTGNRWSATLEGSRVMPPGLQYYIEATDGVSTVRSVSPVFPHTVAVSDRPVITVVSPNRGPIAGGTPVTVAGSNFRTNLTVLLGGAVAENLVWVSANELHCVTPPHYPAAVDVVVTNHGGASGLLVRGFTYDSDRVTVSLPQTGGAQFDAVQVPIGVANAQGLAAADVTVTFNSTVLRGRAARTGTLTSGWSLTANTNTPGELRLSLASPVGTVTGAGSLALLEFDVIGVPGTNSPLHFSVVSLNGGVIGTDLTDGLFTVAAAYRVAGTVRHWGSNAPLPGVIASLNGAQLFTGVSDSNGTYAVTGVPTAAYTLTPSKPDGANGISAYDASLVLRHAAGLASLTGNAAVAADVDKSGAINSMDAFYILQNVVGLLPLPFPGAGELWTFSPASRSYPSLTANQTGQDFTGILLGDVSGNWSLSGSSLMAPSGGSREPKDGSPPVVLALRSLTTRSNGTQLWLLANVAEPGLYSLDLKLRYNATTNWVARVQAGAFAGGLALAANTEAPGVVRAAFAGALPLQGIGAMLLLSLTNSSGGDFVIESAQVNEGAVAVVVDETQFDQDSDGDGATDWLEIRAGTDALERSSLFAFKDVQANPDGSRVLTWSSVPGKQYQLLYQDEASAPNWLPVGGEVTADGPTSSRVDTSAVGTAHRLYRVKLLE